MNRLHVYWGEGKGKTTAAMGLALRSLGHGNRVLIGQFIKDGTSGELAALRQFANAEVCPAEPLYGLATSLPEAERRAAARAQAAYLVSLQEKLTAFQPQTVILDELGMALFLEMVGEAAARALIASALICGETVVTGRYAPAWLLEQADYVSRIDAMKHPYLTEGLKARQGVEW